MTSPTNSEAEIIETAQIHISYLEGDDDDEKQREEEEEVENPYQAVQQQQKQQTEEEASQRIRSFTMNQDENLILIGKQSDGGAELFSFDTHHPENTFNRSKNLVNKWKGIHKKEVAAVAFSPDSKFLAFSGFDPKVVVCERTKKNNALKNNSNSKNKFNFDFSEKVSVSTSLQTDNVWAISFDSSSTLLAVTGYGKTITISDLTCFVEDEDDSSSSPFSTTNKFPKLIKRIGGPNDKKVVFRGCIYRMQFILNGLLKDHLLVGGFEGTAACGVRLFADRSGEFALLRTVCSHSNLTNDLSVSSDGAFGVCATSGKCHFMNLVDDAATKSSSSSSSSSSSETETSTTTSSSTLIFIPSVYDTSNTAKATSAATSQHQIQFVPYTFYAVVPEQRRGHLVISTPASSLSQNKMNEEEENDERDAIFFTFLDFGIEREIQGKKGYPSVVRALKILPSQVRKQLAKLHHGDGENNNGSEKKEEEEKEKEKEKEEEGSGEFDSTCAGSKHKKYMMNNQQQKKQASPSFNFATYSAQVLFSPRSAQWLVCSGLDSSRFLCFVKNPMQVDRFLKRKMFFLIKHKGNNQDLALPKVFNEIFNVFALSCMYAKWW